MPLIRFIGCPASGKTTTAAMVFAKLKDQGTHSEFVPEQARLHIAQHRYTKNLRPQDSLTLNDQDQLQILGKQTLSEHMMVTVCGPDVVVISDTSPLTALLYMTPKFRNDPQVQEHLAASLKDKALWFYTPPIKTYMSGLDPNRIHSAEQSKQIDAQIPQLMQDFAADVQLILLQGTAEQRARRVVTAIYNDLIQV